jgi:uncharacterized protein with HEPN domain
MTHSRDSIHFLRDIQQMMAYIQEFVVELTNEQFVDDTKTYFAVIRALEVIGEATKNIQEETRQQYPDLPWKRMAGMRDRLIHSYFGVDANIVWETATKLIPELLPLVNDVIVEEERNMKKGDEPSNE